MHRAQALKAKPLTTNLPFGLLGKGFSPVIAGYRLQGTASSPLSTASHQILKELTTNISLFGQKVKGIFESAGGFSALTLKEFPQ